MCGPTRRSLLTGVYPHTHTNFYNELPVPFEQVSYLKLLSDGGYDSDYFGKWHAGPGDAADHGCKGVSSMEGYGNPYIHRDYKDYLAENNLPEATFRIDHVLGWEEWGDRQPGSTYPGLVEGNADYHPRNPYGAGEHAAGVLLTPKETHEAFYLANRAYEALRTIAARDDDVPFSLRVDFWGPHPPYFPTQEYLDMYKDVEFPEYPSWNSGLAGKPDCYHR